jgi:hypothetical protein
MPIDFRRTSPVATAAAVICTRPAFDRPGGVAAGGINDAQLHVENGWSIDIQMARLTLHDSG